MNDMQSEADPMLITTDRWNMTQEQLRQLRADKARLEEQVNTRDIQIEQFKQGVKRQALGILGLVGLTFDDLHAWVINKEEKKK
jgi:SMC interacting uncharacterized protein involved in chromosome segregation